MIRILTQPRDSRRRRASSASAAHPFLPRAGYVAASELLASMLHSLSATDSLQGEAQRGTLRIGAFRAVAGLDRVQAFARAHCARLAGEALQKPELAKGQECDVPFPGLRARPWHATEELGWVARLEEDWREARDELTAFLALLDEGGFVKPETALCPETGRFEKLVLCEDGSRAIETATRVGRDHFARTLALLRSSGAPLGPAPVSMNRQPAGSGLPPHSDNANFLLTGHLGLVVPDDGVCEFVMVDSEARRWREGGVLLADTSFVHATRNDCEADRVVLHFTVWHPDLAAAERDGIVRLHEALRAAGG